MKLLRIIGIFFFTVSIVFGQFGQNRIQYKDFEWYFIQTKHFDIYFTMDGKTIAEFTAMAAEDAVEQIQSDFDYQINNRISLIVYNSHNDFQETNTIDAFLSQGTGGFTERFKNRVVFPFEGSYDKFRHVIHHELVHAVMNDMLYGGTIQNVISKGITLQLPDWVHEGMAEFLSSDWETNTDMFIRDAIINEYLPDINRLGGYYAYRGGQAVFKFIAETYGREKVGDILRKTKGQGSIEAGLKTSLGIDLEELNERWKKYLKKEFWPAIAEKEDPDDFSKRLTDNKKDGGFYNTSPAISPQGDKIAFISDRDIFLDIYIMNATDGEIIKQVVQTGQSNDFEELNILFPALTWAPDNKQIALSVKSGGHDVIKIIDVDSEDSFELPFGFDGIESVSWSNNSDKIAFIGSTASQSDIYVYDLNLKELINLTNDIFSDADPSWSFDDKFLYFSSDRGNYIDPKEVPDDFMIFNHDFGQLDLYSIEIESNKVTRITDWEFSSERSAVTSNDGKYILFVSDKNGIYNIYRKKIVIENTDNFSEVKDIPAYPVTNSLNGINQLSASADRKKLVFTSLFKGGYNIFLLNNPFDLQPLTKELTPTNFIAKQLNSNSSNAEKIDSILANRNAIEPESDIHPEKIESDSTKNQTKIFTGQYEPEKDSISIAENEYKNYIFGNHSILKDSSQKAQNEIQFAEKLDDNGNFLINKYKVNFTPDIIYANAGYSTYYGLLGTTVLSFSDLLGNHRLIGITSLQIDLKNSDYGLAYFYLGKRMDLGIEAFHTARFVYLRNGFYSDLYRFRNFGAIFSASYPINRFDRIDGSLGVLSVSSENLDDIAVASQKTTYIVPSISFVHDNTMWGYFSPIQGTRYKLDLFANPGITNSQQSFFSFLYDYRKYFRFWFDNSFVLRLSGGYSAGKNPQRFFLGGTENWINRTFATGDIPFNSPTDFAFFTPALPMRGFDYAEKIGSKYALFNIELRMPLIRYLLTGPLPLLFQNILGTVFIDAGTAWNDNSSLKLFGKDENGLLRTKDLLLATGVGARIYFIFLWRFDVAWSYDMQNFSKPKYYLSLGVDF